MAAAVTPQAEALARLAVEETGFGVVADKVQKNLFASERVHAFIRPMPTVGVIGRDETKRVIEIAEPFGVVAAIVPSTNPTSTAIYKLLIAIKARCAVVLSPHPSAARCITRIGRDHGRGGPGRRSARRRDRLDDHGHAGRHAGADESARGVGDPRDRRHGPGASRLQRGQARLRGRAGQRALLRRVERRRGQGGPRHRRSARASTTASCARRPTPWSSTARSIRSFGARWPPQADTSCRRPRARRSPGSW